MAEEENLQNDTYVNTTWKKQGLEPASQWRSKVTAERVALVVLSVLLLAAVAALTGVTVAYCSGPCTHQCDTDWNLNGTKCYYFSTNKLSWNQSEDECVTMEGDLVKIESTEEQKFLYYRTRALMAEAEDRFWIGLTDSESEGEWKWTDGSSLDPTLTFWFFNDKWKEPDNWKGSKNEYPDGQDCVRMGEGTFGYETKCWFDRACSSEQRYICEKNANCAK